MDLPAELEKKAEQLQKSKKSIKGKEVTQFFFIMQSQFNA